MNSVVKIQGKHSTLLLLLPHAGMPQILTVLANTGQAETAQVTARANRPNGMDVDVPANVLLPTGGLGAFQWPAIMGHREGRYFVLNFCDWQCDQPSASQICLKALDPIAKIALQIDLQFSSADILVMSTALTNLGADVYQLDRCMAGSVLVNQDDITSFDGMWGREFQLRAEKLGTALWIKESRRGRTSHDRFPALIFGDALAGNSPVLGVHLGWSGNHILVVDRLDDGRRLFHAGELFEPGEMRLESGERYNSPKLFAHAAKDTNTMQAAFHAHVRAHILRWPQHEMPPRPVLLNTWEGNYFSHDIASLKAQASAAAALGVERFVLDDGWFKGRNNDKSSLGDWVVDAAKYPNGLRELADHVVALGMDFGLWFEPEMVNPDSDLYRAHPDWALQLAGLPAPLARHQLVLDLSRNEVSDAIFSQMDAVLSQVPIAYIKWDMNRDLTCVGGADGRAATSRQTHAVYALMARVQAAHPKLEIESCASGGGRADYGVLAHCHRIWVSDMTDALERQTIQHGASLFLPPEIMGQHISNHPNHQTGRSHSLSFRAITAINGHFGLEINALDLAAAEGQELTQWIALHKRLRVLLHGDGVDFRIQESFGRMVYGTIARDGSHGVVIAAQRTLMAVEQPQPLFIPHLDANANYCLTVPEPQNSPWVRATANQRALFSGEFQMSGETLAHCGVPLPQLFPESAVLIEVNRIPQKVHTHG